MRAYIPRKRKTKGTPSMMGPLIPPQTKTPMAPVMRVEEKEGEEADFFIPDGDESSSADADEKTPDPEDRYHSHHQQHTVTALVHATSTSCSSLQVLAPIEETPECADLAVAFLEEFFFGGASPSLTPALKNTKALRSGHFYHNNNNDGCNSTIASEVESSPTSISQIPMCSCPPEEQRKYLFTGLHHVTQQHQQQQQDVEQSPSSMRRSSSCSPKPKKPTLKNNRINSSSSLNSSKRNVSFTDISVREYDVELSDHPSCSFGAPIGLGWDYEEKESVPVEDYEVTRSPQRREVHELVLSYNARRRRLKQSGYKKKEIRAVEKEVDRIKRERLVTEFFLPASAIDETFERVFVSLKQLVRRTTSTFGGRRNKQSCHACELHYPSP